jgi:uncharacterized cupin superfamily protein
VLEGEIEATFRGKTYKIEKGATVNIPSNAPHRLHNASSSAARLLCICSPAGLDKFFQEIGVPVATRTATSPKLTKEQEEQFVGKARALAPRYRIELLREA